jgi:predicted RNase H-like HicB family nuclease
MAHYIAVLVPAAGGGWRAYLPDFPGCKAEGATAESAMCNAATAAGALKRKLRDLGQTWPTPRSYNAVRGDIVWAEERGIDWSAATITLLKIS